MKEAGLKDHQIHQLVNAIRDEVQILTPVQCLRELISRATVRYLEENNLRIDDPHCKNQPCRK